jgi:hypothetical protein
MEESNRTDAALVTYVSFIFREKANTI